VQRAILRYHNDGVDHIKENLTMNFRKPLIFASLLLIAAALTLTLPVAGQTTPTATATVTGPSNAATAFLVICDNQAIVNVSGTMLVNFDVYYQVFAGGSATGTALTGVRQIPVAGEFAVSDTVTYTGGSVPVGQTGSANISVARETDSSRIDFEFVVNDLQDGCATPQFTAATSTDTGASASETTNTATAGTLYGINTAILAPNGSTLNPNLLTEAQVVIGARQTDRYRSDTPGLIFAECDAFPLAEPGLVYDNDSVTIFWSWYTATIEDMQQHLDNAIYRVTFNTADLPMTTRSEPIERDGNIYVFYSANVGNLRPGHYEVGYSLNWRAAVNDGYDDYGPGTARPFQNNICNFDVLRNPTDSSVNYTGLYFPTTGPVHNINSN